LPPGFPHGELSALLHRPGHERRSLQATPTRFESEGFFFMRPRFAVGPVSCGSDQIFPDSAHFFFLRIILLRTARSEFEFKLPFVL
jgi:hypothetical protein